MNMDVLAVSETFNDLNMSWERLFNKFTYKELQRIVALEFKQYIALKVQLENKKECEAVGSNQLFLSFDADYKTNELKVKQMERAINVLDEVERQIIEWKYCHPNNYIDTFIYMEIGITKGEFYRKKKSAIFSIALALGII